MALYLRCIVAHNVAEVDDIVETGPCAHFVGRQQVLLQHFIEVVGNVGASHDILGAQLTPDAHTGDHIFAGQGRITAVHRAGHVGLFLPVVLKHRRVHGQDIEEVAAA